MAAYNNTASSIRRTAGSLAIPGTDPRFVNILSCAFRYIMLCTYPAPGMLRDNLFQIPVWYIWPSAVLSSLVRYILQPLWFLMALKIRNPTAHELFRTMTDLLQDLKSPCVKPFSAPLHLYKIPSDRPRYWRKAEQSWFSNKSGRHLLFR